MGNNSSSSSSGGGIVILGLLGVLFVGLKLGGVINWSWAYVTLPFWGLFALISVALIAVLIIVSIRSLIGLFK